MATIRTMFVGHGPSNLPADRIVNVFHFNGPGSYAEELASAEGSVVDFYNASNTTRSIGQWLSPWVQRAAELRSYDMSTTIPRVPTILPITLGSSGGQSGYAEEVALCLTLHGVVPPALTARRRGRLYLGPLIAPAVLSGSDTAPTRPAALFIADVVQAAVRMNSILPTGMHWVIRSVTPSVNYVQIAGGYVDNAFDTQRRRGPDPTDRTLWSFGV